MSALFAGRVRASFTSQNGISMGPQCQVFEQRVAVSASAADLFAWHERPGALQRLMPPWEPVTVISQVGGIRDGAEVVLDVPIAGPLTQRITARHEGYVAGVKFEDRQVSGPFAEFHHVHQVESGPVDASGQPSSVLIDRIEYRPPLGLLGRLLGDGVIRGKLTRMFRYRHRVTADDVAQYVQWKGTPRLRVGVTGSTGLVGSALLPLLTTQGHEAVRFVRRPAKGPDEVFWNPNAGLLDAEALRGLDAIVHLGGQGIADKRWSPAVKQEIRDSRVNSTRLLCERLASLDSPPPTLICASAIGIYGNRGSEALDESSTIGEGFLADVGREWEAACEPARARGVRVVNLRIGVVLAANGGALKAMLPPFLLGGGGVMGSGEQYWSWIALDDLLGSILHALHHTDLSGPVNATAPTPATNREFTTDLGSVVHRPTILPFPGFAATMVVGEMADALLLASTRVVPRRLQETGYRFRMPNLRAAMRHVLGRDTATTNN